MHALPLAVATATAMVVVLAGLELVLQLAAADGTKDTADYVMLATRVVTSICACRTTENGTHQTAVTLLCSAGRRSVRVRGVRVLVVGTLLRELMRRVLLVATVRVLVAVLGLLIVLIRRLLAVLEATLCRRTVGAVALVLLVRLLVVLLRVVARLSVLRRLLVVVVALLGRIATLRLLVALSRSGRTVALLRVLLVRVLVVVIRHCRRDELVFRRLQVRRKAAIQMSTKDAWM